MKRKESIKLELVGSKVPQDVKAVIEKIAEDEDRTVSKSISRLLCSHPEVKKRLRRPRVVVI